MKEIHTQKKKKGTYSEKGSSEQIDWMTWLYTNFLRAMAAAKSCSRENSRKPATTIIGIFLTRILLISTRSTKFTNWCMFIIIWPFPSFILFFFPYIFIFIPTFQFLFYFHKDSSINIFKLIKSTNYPRKHTTFNIL